MRRIVNVSTARAALVLVMTAGLLVAVGAPAGARAARSASTRSDAGGGVRVQAGINDLKDPTIAVLEFLPAKVTVAVGETVTWDWTGAIEPHSVTFFPEGQTPPAEVDEALFLPTTPTGPYDGTTLVNSGLQPLGPAPVPPFEMSFAKPGDFTYYCAIHPNMVGDVTVVPEGDRTDPAAAVAARGKAQQAKWIAEGRAAKRKLEAQRPKPVANDDGTKTWTVAMGTTTAHTDILAFAPTSREIAAGDTVEFVNDSKAPHTATFAGQQEPITNPLAPEASTAIPGPSPQTLDANALFNTGELPPKAGSPPPPASARSFSFVVPVAGKYEYYCILHTLSGMTGDIVAR